MHAARGEVSLQQNHSYGCSQVNFEGGFDRGKFDVADSNMMSTTDENIDEGGDVIEPKQEWTRATEKVQGGARKPLKRKLYSDTGNGPKILE